MLVMPALVAGIHVFMARIEPKTRMAGTSPAMTVGDARGMFTHADLLYSRAAVPRLSYSSTKEKHNEQR
jgi:hypothetical protein